MRNASFILIYLSTTELQLVIIISIKKVTLSAFPSTQYPFRNINIQIEHCQKFTSIKYLWLFYKTLIKDYFSRWWRG